MANPKPEAPNLEEALGRKVYRQHEPQAAVPAPVASVPVRAQEVKAATAAVTAAATAAARPENVAEGPLLNTRGKVVEGQCCEVLETWRSSTMYTEDSSVRPGALVMVERNNVDGNVIVRTTCDKASEEIVPEADLKLVHPSFKVGDKVTTSPFMGTSYCVKRLMKLVWKSFPRIRQSLANSNYANLKATVTEVKPPTQEGFSQTCSIEFELLEEKLKDTGLAPKLCQSSSLVTERRVPVRDRRLQGQQEEEIKGDLPQGLLNKDLIADWPNYKSLSSNLIPEVEVDAADVDTMVVHTRDEGRHVRMMHLLPSLRAKVDTKSGVQEVGFGCRIFDKNQREFHVLGPCFLYRKGW
eukprot:g30945.t1